MSIVVVCFSAHPTKDVASIHHRIWQGFYYIGLSVTAINYGRLSPKSWLILGTVMGLVGYPLLLCLRFVPISWFPFFQTLFGIIAGLGAGVCFCPIIITPQSWLDKTRDQLTPYIFIGAPLFSTFAAPLSLVLIETYSWSGALILVIGMFVCQQFIFLLPFRADPSEPGKSIGSRKIKGKGRRYYQFLTDQKRVKMSANLDIPGPKQFVEANLEEDICLGKKIFLTVI